MSDQSPTIADFLLSENDRTDALQSVESRADQLACLAVTLRDDPSEVALSAFKACRDLLFVEVEKALIIQAASQTVVTSPAKKGRFK